MFDYSNLNLVQSMTIGCWKYYKLTGTLLKDYQVLQKLFLKYKDVTLPDVTELSVEILKKLLKKSPSYKNLSSAEQKSVKDLAHALTIACSQRIKAVHKKLNIVYKNGNLQWKYNSNNQALKVINERFQNQTNKIEKSLALIAIPELRKIADVMMYSSYPFIKTYCNRVNSSPSNYGSPFEERFQNVVIGYLAATMSWDYKNGAKFSTFALFYGRSIASRNDVENNMNFHFNVGFVQRCKNLSKHSITLRNEVSTENPNQDYHQIEKKVRILLGPTLIEVEEYTASLGHKYDYESNNSLIESLDSFEELSELNLSSISYTDHNVYEELYHSQLVSIVDMTLYNLTVREGTVLRMSYFNNMTLEGIGEALEVSRERVRQIQAKALRKLRQSRNAGPLLSFKNGTGFCNGEMAQIYFKDRVSEFIEIQTIKMFKIGYNANNLEELIDQLDHQSQEQSSKLILLNIATKLHKLVEIDSSFLEEIETFLEETDTQIVFPQSLDELCKNTILHDSPTELKLCCKLLRKNPSLFFYVFQ